MNSIEISEPGIGLSFTRCMPLSWKLIGLHSDAGEAGMERTRNERLLQLLLLYDDYSGERRDEDKEQTSDLQRLETKLDVVIQLLAGLIAERGSSSGERQVTVSAHHLEWLEDESTAPALEERLWVLPQIDPRLPQPLKLAVQVARLTPVAGGGCNVRVELEAQTDTAQQALEKYIFRIHRREIARMRTGQ